MENINKMEARKESEATWWVLFCLGCSNGCFRSKCPPERAKAKVQVGGCCAGFGRSVGLYDAWPDRWLRQRPRLHALKFSRAGRELLFLCRIGPDVGSAKQKEKKARKGQSEGKQAQKVKVTAKPQKHAAKGQNERTARPKKEKFRPPVCEQNLWV